MGVPISSVVKNPLAKPTTRSTLCRTPHLNNKQNKNTNPIINRQDYHLTQPCPSEEKQTNRYQKKLSTNFTLYEVFTNHWTNLRQAETKRKKEVNLEAWQKETSNTITFFKKNKEKAEKYYINEGTN